MNYALRQAREDDFIFLYNLKVTCLKDYVAATYGWDDEYQLRRFTEYFDPSMIQIIIVHDNDIGYLSVEDEGDDLYIAAIYLTPEWQNQGLGTSVIMDILAAAAGSKREVSLQVLRVNPALRLYERLGFKIYEESDTHIKLRWG